MSYAPSKITQAGPALLYRIVMIAAVGGFLFGYDMALISGAALFLQKAWHLDPSAFGAINASALIGCPIGCFIGLWMADSWGRQKALIFASFLFVASGIGCALSKGVHFDLGFVSVMDFNFWRLIGGAGVGLASTVSPMYIAEISPPRLRGRMVVINQLANVIGIILSAFVSYFIAEHAKKAGIADGNWPMMFWTLLIPAGILLVGLLTVPSSPRWLALKNRDNEALDVLTLINGPEQAQKELSEIRQELGEETGGWKELFQPGVTTALVVGAILMIFSQINGANMVLGYSPKLFVAAGITATEDAIWNSIYVFAWIMCTTISSFWLTAKCGRRPILIWGVVGIAVGNALMFLQFWIKLPMFVTFIAMFTSAGAFTLTLAPLSWVILSEIFPNRVRGKAMSISTVLMFIAGYYTSKNFPVLSDMSEKAYGHPGAIWLGFAVIDLLCVFFVWKWLPETKDKTLEEIGHSWLAKH